MTMHKALHLSDDTDRQNVSRKDGAWGLAITENCVDASIQRLKEYIHKRGGKLITAIKNNTDNTIIKKIEINSKEKWEWKQLDGDFKWKTNEISHEKTCSLKRETLKKEKESPLIAAQNNAIRANYIHKNW